MLMCVVRDPSVSKGVCDGKLILSCPTLRVCVRGYHRIMSCDEDLSTEVFLHCDGILQPGQVKCYDANATFTGRAGSNLSTQNNHTVYKCHMIRIRVSLAFDASHCSQRACRPPCALISPLRSCIRRSPLVASASLFVVLVQARAFYVSVLPICSRVRISGVVAQ